MTILRFPVRVGWVCIVLGLTGISSNRQVTTGEKVGVGTRQESLPASEGQGW